MHHVEISEMASKRKGAGPNFNKTKIRRFLRSLARSLLLIFEPSDSLCANETRCKLHLLQSVSHRSHKRERERETKQTGTAIRIIVSNFSRLRSRKLLQREERKISLHLAASFIFLSCARQSETTKCSVRERERETRQGRAQIPIVVRASERAAQ